MTLRSLNTRKTIKSSFPRMSNWSWLSTKSIFPRRSLKQILCNVNYKNNLDFKFIWKIKISTYKNSILKTHRWTGQSTGTSRTSWTSSSHWTRISRITFKASRSSWSLVNYVLNDNIKTPKNVKNLQLGQLYQPILLGQVVLEEPSLESLLNQLQL